MDVNINCAIAGYNVEFLPGDIGLSASNANVVNDPDTKKIVMFCLACKPKFRRIFPVFVSDQSTLPYIVSECESIDFCAKSDWFNYCSECIEKYAFKYTSEGIDYSNCVEYSEDQYCYVFEEIGQNISCIFCKKGYSKNKDGFCEIILPM